MDAAEIKELYSKLRSEIEYRLKKFRTLWEKEDERDVFAEMVFCLLTPQSKARVCWTAVERMKWDILIKGNEEEIVNCLVGVRFKYTKARRIIEVRERFVKYGEVAIRTILERFEEPEEARDWLVSNISGYGYKEASHFLRNIGLGENLAILDRHILRNLEEAGVIERMPKTLTKRKYLEIEGRMRDFSIKTGIPMGALDLIFWYMGTDEIFK